MIVHHATIRIVGNVVHMRLDRRITSADKAAHLLGPVHVGDALVRIDADELAVANKRVDLLSRVAFAQVLQARKNAH